jgi:hypothetical protein
MITPIVSSKYRYLLEFCYLKIFSTNHVETLVLLDDPGRVRSQITSLVCQIQRFDFDCNLVLTRKVIIQIPPGLGLNPLQLCTHVYTTAVAGSIISTVLSTRPGTG